MCGRRASVPAKAMRRHRGACEEPLAAGCLDGRGEHDVLCDHALGGGSGGGGCRAWCAPMQMVTERGVARGTRDVRARTNASRSRSGRSSRRRTDGRVGPVGPQPGRGRTNPIARGAQVHALQLLGWIEENRRAAPTASCERRGVTTLTSSREAVSLTVKTETGEAVGFKPLARDRVGRAFSVKGFAVSPVRLRSPPS
jgi:hypothetical protein